MGTKKDKEYSVDQISNLLELLPAQRFFISKKYKEQSFSEKEWKKKFKQDNI